MGQLGNRQGPALAHCRRTLAAGCATSTGRRVILAIRIYDYHV